MMSLTFGLFSQVSGSGPLGPLVKRDFFHLQHWFWLFSTYLMKHMQLFGLIIEGQSSR